MELNIYIEKLKKLIEKAITNYETQIAKVAIGRANPTLISKIKVNYYDSLISIEEICSITVSGPLQLIVKPYDIASIKQIEKAITDYNLNVNVVNEGHQIRISYPQLTTNKRKELVKQLTTITEQAKVVVRQARQDINKEIKADIDLSEDLVKHYLEIVQKEVDNGIKKIDVITAEKEKDLMTI